MKNEKHEIQNADSTIVPQKWLKERWYADPKRKAIGASGKNISIRVGATNSPAYADNYDKVFGKTPVEKFDEVEKTRFDLTHEEIGARYEFGPEDVTEEMKKAAEVVVFKGHTTKPLTKWMTPEAVEDYHNAVHNGLLELKTPLENDPHSRRLVLKGPKCACWVYTTFLSRKYGGYTLLAHYRSMEVAHQPFDVALQFAIAKKAGIKVDKLILSIDSLHTYC